MDIVNQEICIWKELFNDNIIRIYEITKRKNYDPEKDNYIFLTMEYAKYGPIAKEIKINDQTFLKRNENVF